jgi:NADPH-dependent ferric siderophore reductase
VRGSIRTYTFRDAVGSGVDTRLIVDVVVHEPPAGEPVDGAGNAWALQAKAGDELVILCPRRGHPFGGIEWAPGDATRLLLVGDETAAPAIRGILRDLPRDACGAAFIETVADADIYDDVAAPAGVEVHWLPRNGGRRGGALQPAVLRWLKAEEIDGTPAVSDDEIDPNLWETPIHSSSGQEISVAPAGPLAATPYPDLYAWIAGESKLVTGLRRTLVTALAIPRPQVAFMGYWREGVPMRS